MRTVTVTEEGVVELAFMWLPVFFGINSALRQDMESSLKGKIEGRPLTEELLDEADNLVIEFIEAKFPHIKGIRDYLEALKYVHFEEA